MRLQGELDAAAHERNLAAIKLQADLGVKTIAVQAEADVSRLDATTFGQAVVESMKPTRIWLVDLWNGIVCPAAATIALAQWCVALNAQGFKMTDWDSELVGVILGLARQRTDGSAVRSAKLAAAPTAGRALRTRRLAYQSSWRGARPQCG